jgi:hypothetical protein
VDVQGIPEPEENWMFYIHPLGHGLYLREDIDGDRRERPVFTHNGAPTWHPSGVQSDQQEYEMKPPSEEFWKAVRQLYVAAQQDDDEDSQEIIEQLRRIQGTLEYHEADTVDKLFSTLHQLDCPAREIEIFDRMFAEIENKSIAEEAKQMFKEKYEELTSSNQSEDGNQTSTGENE